MSNEIDTNDFSFYILADGTLMCTAANLKSSNVKFDNNVKFGGYSLGEVITAINNLPSSEEIEFESYFYGEYMENGTGFPEWLSNTMVLYSNGDIAVGIQVKDQYGDYFNVELPSLPTDQYRRYDTQYLNCIVIKFINIPLTTITGLTLYVYDPSTSVYLSKLWVKYGAGDEDLLYNGQVSFATPTVDIVFDQPFQVQEDSFLAIYFTYEYDGQDEIVWLEDKITFTGTS